MAPGEPRGKGFSPPSLQGWRTRSSDMGRAHQGQGRARQAEPRAPLRAGATEGPGRAETVGLVEPGGLCLGASALPRPPIPQFRDGNSAGVMERPRTNPGSDRSEDAEEGQEGLEERAWSLDTGLGSDPPTSYGSGTSPSTSLSLSCPTGWCCPSWMARSRGWRFPGTHREAPASIS